MILEGAVHSCEHAATWASLETRNVFYLRKKISTDISGLILYSSVSLHIKQYVVENIACLTCSYKHFWLKEKEKKVS